MAFLFKKKGHSEQERVSHVEAELDTHSIACLEAIGIGLGWTCLEVGAGGGSMANWLIERVGPLGKVVATDLQTKYLERIEAFNFEARKHDILSDDLEQGIYDLVFARKVLEHLSDPALALKKMSDALKSGGCLVVEDTDMISLRRVSSNHSLLFNRVYSAFIDLMIESGFNPTIGAELGDELRSLGLLNVKMQGRTSEWSGSDDNPGGALYRSTFDRLRKRITSSGDISSIDIDVFLNEIQSPEFHAMTSIHFTAWGFKR